METPLFDRVHKTIESLFWALGVHFWLLEVNYWHLPANSGHLRVDFRLLKIDFGLWESLRPLGIQFFLREVDLRPLGTDFGP